MKPYPGKQISNELRALLFAIGQSEWNKEVIDMFTGFDNKKLIGLAEKHRITPLVFNYLSQQIKNPNPELSDELKILAREHILKTLRLQSELTKICSVFNQHGIEYIVLKGPQLSHLLYGNASIRVCVDLDIFLKHRTDIQLASELLAKLGYHISNLPSQNRFFSKKMFSLGKHETAFFNRQTRTYIDLHLRPVGNSLFSSHYHKILFSNLQSYELNGISLPVPSMENYFLFLCYHGTVHQYASLHWLADVYTFMKRFPMPIDRLERQARKLRLEKHLAISLLLIHKLLEYPLKENYPDSRKRKNVLEKLYYNCLESICREQQFAFTLKERWQKTVYRFKLAEGILGKADTVITIFFRYFYRIINPKGTRMVKRD